MSASLTRFATPAFRRGAESQPMADGAVASLRRAMQRPQRHRLLHGYPLAAAMPYADVDVRKQAENGDPCYSVDPVPNRRLLVGVLPHPFCNPTIRGCGYCTFPHEKFHSARARAIADAIVYEMRCSTTTDSDTRRVDGLYFGGGTANLTPTDAFEQIARNANQVFDLSDAEVTLEGVPAYFLSRSKSLLDALEDAIDARHFRISMGLQTFSEVRLKQMGRAAFGGPDTFGRAVHEARRRNMTVSGDILFNLPGQSQREMLEDIRRAADIGLDQICAYHLVLFRGLGTVWAQDEKKLASLPTNAAACENWLAVRDQLLRLGYRQTSLTNFERKELASDSRRYQYELMSFDLGRYQMLGFGPGGISFRATPDLNSGLKVLNPEAGAKYLQATRRSGPVWERYFRYAPRDLEILHMTRSIAGLRIDKPSVAAMFGDGVITRSREIFDALASEGLMIDTGDAFVPTPTGMFYSDAITGLLAKQRLGERVAGNVTETLNSNGHGHM